MDDAKAAAVEAIRKVHRTTALPQPLGWLTDGVQVQWNEIRRNHESGWAEP
jgi:hypothetical protein